MPFYIPVLSQGSVSLLFSVCIGKSIVSSQAIPKVGDVYWGSKGGTNHTCSEPLSFSKKKRKKKERKPGCCHRHTPHVLDFKTSRGSQHTNHSESRAGTKCQLHTSQAQRNTVSTFATTNKNESRHPSKAE